MPRPLPALAAVLLLALAGTAFPAWAQSDSDKPSDWRVRIGAGAFFKPEYPGADDMTVMPIPDFDITWRNRLFLNVRNGLGVYAVNAEDYTLGASVGPHLGRDEDASDRLDGMGAIDTTAQAKLFGRYRLGGVDLGATLGRDLGAGEGFVLDLSAAHPFQAGRQWRIAPSVGATLADDDYMQSWFGVTSAQSARSGLAAYRPDGGLLSANASLNVSYFLTEHWILGSTLKVERLMGDAADSPVVEEKTQPSLRFSVSRRF